MIFYSCLFVLFIIILSILLLDLNIRRGVKRIQLISSKDNYPKHIQTIGDPLIGLGKFFYAALVSKKSDYYIFKEQFDRVDKKHKTYTNFFFGIHSIVTWNPEYCKQIFVKDKNWGKVKSFEIFDSLMGESVVSVEGNHWKSQRKILNPSFAPSYIKNLLPPFVKIANTLCDRLDEMENKEGTFEPSVWMSKATLDSLGTAGFGLDFDALNDNMTDVYKAYEGMLKGFTNPLKFFSFYNKMPFKSNKDFDKSVEDFWKWAKIAIDKKRSSSDNPEGVTDLLDAMVSSHFIEDNDNDKYHLSDKELLQNIFLFFLAGHETTSGTLTFVLDFLARHQDIQDKCRKEVIDMFGYDEPTSAEQINNLKYMDNVIHETMRMRSPVAAISRQAKQDCELDGYFIPKGTMAIGVIVNLHHDPDIWEDPETFNPDRWINNTRKGVNFMPFGTGARLCLGMSFANLEMRIMLTKMLQRYSFHVHEDMIIERAITMRPQEGYRLKIKKINL